ncbi:hypothetical protein L2E82_10301 [Cichorium intybus]|uniref:Uncharacterized protein n=1 Tax=Cichorium intybus TaxID=13427 RepID=A0ACB9G9N7_CICIN|nr:hypothetical protein L2E82_10301 [Cichorium intybus]
MLQISLASQCLTLESRVSTPHESRLHISAGGISTPPQLCYYRSTPPVELSEGRSCRTPRINNQEEQGIGECTYEEEAAVKLVDNRGTSNWRKTWKDISRSGYGTDVAFF